MLINADMGGGRVEVIVTKTLETGKGGTHFIGTEPPSLETGSPDKYAILSVQSIRNA